MKRNSSVVVVLLSACAVLAVAASQLHEAAYACTIAYDGPNNPTLQAASGTGNFSGNVVTSLVQDSPCITLHVNDVPGLSSNVTLDSGFPLVTHLDACTAAYWDAFSGHLNSLSSNGTAAFSSWDGTNFNCSGTHYRAINKP
jgi:hypothetical protein